MFGSLGLDFEMDVLFLGRRQHVSGKVEVVDALHNDHGHALLFVVVAGGESVAVRGDLALDLFRLRLFAGLMRIVDNYAIMNQYLVPKEVMVVINLYVIDG